MARTDSSPTVSILVPLYNEEEFIGAVLERVLAAPLPEGFQREIIVADDGSSDGSDKVVAEAAARYPALIRLIRHDQNLGKGRRSEPPQMRRAANTASFKTPIWNTIRGSIRGS